MRTCFTQAARKHGLAKLPKLVEIINAVPEEHRAMLLPQCARCFCFFCVQACYHPSQC